MDLMAILNAVRFWPAVNTNSIQIGFCTPADLLRGGSLFGQVKQGAVLAFALCFAGACAHDTALKRDDHWQGMGMLKSILKLGRRQNDEEAVPPTLPDRDQLEKTAAPQVAAPILINVPESKAPEGAVLQWVDSHGMRLRTAHWRPTTPQTKGTICLVQGRTEFIEKYYELIADLRARGFAVLAFDFRGQGGSDRLLRQADRGHVEDFADYVADLEAVVHDVMLPECPAPFFALAHSMGGAVMLHSLQTGYILFDRIILTAPMVRLNRKRPGQATLARLMHLLSGLGLGERPVPFFNPKAFEGNSIADNLLTSDEARYRRTVSLRRQADFLNLGAPTIGWMHAACEAMAAFDDPEFGRNNRTPVLTLASATDKIVDMTATEQLTQTMRSIWMIAIPGARHEITQEADQYRSQFWAAFDAFIPGDRTGL